MEHLRWSFLQKSSIVDVLQGSKNAFQKLTTDNNNFVKKVDIS